VRHTFLAVAAMALFATLQGAGQPSHPRLFPHSHLLPHPHPPHPAQPSEVPPAEAIFDATNLGTPLVLDKDWRVGITADPGAQHSDFDDSSWAVREASPSIADVPEPENSDQNDQAASNGPPLRPFAWFRLHVKLAPGHGPVSLLIELPVSHNTSMDFGTQATGSDVEVYANGRRIPPQGPHGDDGDVGFLPMSTLQANIRAGLDSVKVGSVSEVLVNPAGFNIFRVTEKKAEREYELAEIKDELPDAVQQIQFKEKYEAWVKTLRAKAVIEVRKS
jgi:hypothetical protein